MKRLFVKRLFDAITVGFVTGFLWGIGAFLFMLISSSYETARQVFVWVLCLVGSVTFFGMLWFYRYSWEE